MSDDLIVVDDIGDLDVDSLMPPPDTPRTSSSGRPMRRTSAASRLASVAALGGPADAPAQASTERTTRSAAKQRAQPKLKLKLSDKAAAQVAGMSFLGAYDRELDDSDEDLTFDEHFILRLPPGDDCERLRRAVASREVGSDVWFKFKDSRRAIFHVGNSTYSSKLVDLPCIIEAQKTLDNKQMFKVADICQMLVVEDRIENEQALNNSKTFNLDEYIWPHGITPPLHHVRKRRFRKRANKRTIESVEQEVERLLEADAAAESSKYEVLENVNPDLSDSEFVEREDFGYDGAGTPGPAGSEAGDAPTPAAAVDDGEGADDGEDDEEGDNEIDEELAAELDLALGDDEEEDEDEDDDESEDEEEDEDDEEGGQARQLLNEEIRDLQAAVAKKERESASSANPLIKRRFEDALKKLRADLDSKLEQLEDMKEHQRQLRLREEGGAPPDGGVGGGADDGALGGGDDDDDLFGPEDAMDLS